ncbi:MAG: squalene/phytoene synthase family protein [Chloroflexota bacterium]
MTSRKLPSSNDAMAAAITRAASKQTYYTIHFLADRGLVQDAYRAYAYFRWVDDWLDGPGRDQAECLAFVNRQHMLVDQCYRGEQLRGLADEEDMLVDLISGDRGKSGSLQSYIRNMMAVMAFDAGRRGRLVSREELANYTRWLAVAVTEAMHHFIGHNCPSPRGNTRYLAVSAAHITHMLRDTLEDVGAGYFNIPREFLDSQGVQPWDVNSEAYRAWVRRRVQLARVYFDAGRESLAQVVNARCRLASLAYMARFETVLDLIERDGYCLRREYPERRSPGYILRMGWSVLSRAVTSPRQEKLPRVFANQIESER